MLPEITQIMMAQSPIDFTGFDFWFSTLTLILNVFYALSIRGYLIFLLIGFIIYTTTYADGFGKFFVGLALFLFFAGPLVINVFAQLAAVEEVTFQSATTTWLGFFGMSDADMIFTIMWFGDAVGAICCLLVLLSILQKLQVTWNQKVEL